jgi:pyruvate/2-oxoglutarate dehydrogenase complex dihydrolipoamide dehydrogenase (E3) component
MMHYSALLAEARDDQNRQGWNIDRQQQFQWDTLVKNVQAQIKSLNWGYKSDMIKNKIRYINSYASFVDQHTVLCDNGKK